MFTALSIVSSQVAEFGYRNYSPIKPILTGMLGTSIQKLYTAKKSEPIITSNMGFYVDEQRIVISLIFFAIFLGFLSVLLAFMSLKSSNNRSFSAGSVAVSTTSLIATMLYWYKTGVSM